MPRSIYELINFSNRADIFCITAARARRCNPEFWLREKLKIFNDGGNFWKVVERKLFAFVSYIIALGIDDTQNEMAGVLAVRVKGIFIAVSFPEIACKRTQCHAVYFVIS